ncbi:DNA (cytosine-5-)-methyltransferase [Bacillus inaquosorum]|uniref:DNA cytosine methyltransferase n=1 Tax=Bacillus inaquosorum TaxID=483913 RepID=UPI00227ED0E2|nr:DNA (cytosine-5-)-methyltransferase [Bacillus inaquosorum]MCY7983378.1 DNA (cytosine-5-)-methyltransferase [Bacillus inaquosorum]
MKSIELFAGIGGIALAAEWAGIETVAFCEREPFCQKVLNKNFPGVPIFDDVRTLNRQLLEEKGVIEPGGTIDIISGGFPCQPYSIAGEQRGTEDDRDLWPEMFRLIKELRPTWVVGENVANFANMELDRTLSDLESEGYKGKSFIIPALAIGAPHRRDRVFVVGYLSNANSIGYKGTERLPENNDKVTKWRKSTFRTVTKLFNGVDWEKRACESGFLGSDDGVPNRLDRIKGLGNAVVPQQIYPIFKAIMDQEDENK